MVSCSPVQDTDCWSLRTLSTLSLDSAPSADRLDDHDHDYSKALSAVSSTNTKTKGRKRVSFCYAVKVIDYVRNRCDYSKQEILQCWYNQEEYQSIQSRKRETVTLIGEGHEFPVHDEDHCVDGLYTAAESSRRRARYRSAQYVVFMEQEHQRQEQVDWVYYNPEPIKEAYNKYTKSSQKLARARADQMAKEVRTLSHGEAFHWPTRSHKGGNSKELSGRFDTTVDHNHHQGGVGLCLPKNPKMCLSYEYLWADWSDLFTLFW
jgi:hypothetical protein